MHLCDKQFHDSIRSAGQEVKILVAVKHGKHHRDILRAALFAGTLFEGKAPDRLYAHFGAGLYKLHYLTVAPYVGGTPVDKLHPYKMQFAESRCAPAFCAVNGGAFCANPKR